MKEETGVGIFCVILFKSGEILLDGLMQFNIVACILSAIFWNSLTFYFCWILFKLYDVKFFQNIKWLYNFMEWSCSLEINKETIFEDYTAKELKFPIGEIQCPHCNFKSLGMVTPICPVCEKNIFEVFGTFIPKTKENENGL